MNIKTTSLNNLVAGIEAGGTKFNCVIADTTAKVLKRLTLPTQDPNTTLTKVSSFFVQAQQELGTIAALGIGSFGPVEINPSSSRYGQITSTPKTQWRDFDILGYFQQRFSIPIAFETDVNCAAIGESIYGAAQDKSNFIYVTIGTGIGAGIVTNGQLYSGVSHPEIGHMMVAPYNSNRQMTSCCPFHNNCLEGVASGPAIKKHWEIEASELPIDHQAWAMEAYYLAQMCMNLTLSFTPEKIVLGGGVMNQQHLFPLIRNEFSQLLNNYLTTPNLTDLDNYIVPSLCKGNAGEIGAVEIAIRKLQSRVAM